MDRQYVGIDCHRGRSVIRKNAAGEKLSSVRVANDPWVIAAAVSEAAPHQVVIEATYGWYWIVDWLQEQGATLNVQLPPAGSLAFAYANGPTDGIAPQRNGRVRVRQGERRAARFAVTERGKHS